MGDSNEFNLSFTQDSQIICIDQKYVDDIPILFWKLYMVYEKREKDIQKG